MQAGLSCVIDGQLFVLFDVVVDCDSVCSCCTAIVIDVITMLQIIMHLYGHAIVTCIYIYIYILR